MHVSDAGAGLPLFRKARIFRTRPVRFWIGLGGRITPEARLCYPIHCRQCRGPPSVQPALPLNEVNRKACSPRRRAVALLLLVRCPPQRRAARPDWAVSVATRLCAMAPHPRQGLPPAPAADPTRWGPTALHLPERERPASPGRYGPVTLRRGPEPPATLVRSLVVR